MSNHLDKTDRQILRLLQQDARITNAELADQVNLSPTPCLRRVKRLEESGVIRNYVTELDREKVGLHISAFVFIQLVRNSSDNARDFEEAIQGLEQVMECFVLTGEYDYLLRVVSEDLKTYEAFIKDGLAGIPQISRIDTTIILNQVMSRHTLPLPK